MTDKPTPTDAELNTILCDHWPAFAMQSTLVKILVRDALQDAIDKWGQPAHSGEPVAWRSAVLDLIDDCPGLTMEQDRWLSRRVKELEFASAPRPMAQSADSVQEDAAREAIEKVLALFPFNALIQKFSVNNGPCLTADNDDEFYSVKRVLAFLTEIKTTLDAARKQGGL